MFLLRFFFERFEEKKMLLDLVINQNAYQWEKRPIAPRPLDDDDRSVERHSGLHGRPLLSGFRPDSRISLIPRVATTSSFFRVFLLLCSNGNCALVSNGKESSAAV